MVTVDQVYMRSLLRSEFLKARLPYDPAQHTTIFTPEIEPHEVRTAFGRRGMQKCADVLSLPSATDVEVADALLIIYYALSTQEKKVEAIKCDIVERCRKLLDNESVSVRTNAAAVIGQLLLLQVGRTAAKDTDTALLLSAQCSDSNIQVSSMPSHLQTRVLTFVRRGRLPVRHCRTCRSSRTAGRCSWKRQELCRTWYVAVAYNFADTEDELGGCSGCA